MSNSNSRLLEQARLYTRLGWKVLPLYSIVNGCCSCGDPKCSSPGKHPFSPLVTNGVKDASAKLDFIEGWFERKDLNIGICTGPESGLVVLDVDPRHGGDVSLQDFEVPETPMVITGGNGLHYYFRHPEGLPLRNSAGTLAAGLDTRGLNGYVVAPPSLHVSGGQYRWQLDPSVVELADCPDWIAQQKNVPDKPVLHATGQVIPEGKRDSTLTSLAGTMRRKGMTENEIQAALTEANQDRCRPPLPDKDVQRIAKSVSRYEPQTPNVQPVLIRMSDVESREVQWLWRGRVALGRISLLVGMPGMGKSFLTAYMASRVTTRSPWPEGSPCPMGSVILISAEDDPGDTIRPRLDAHHADPARVHLLSMVVKKEKGKTRELMFTLQDLEALESSLQQIPDCKLIVIDPIGSFLGAKTDAYRDNEVRGVLAPVAQLAEKYGPAVVIVAHRRKTTSTFADDLALGSRAFTGIARTVLHLTRLPQDKARRLLLPGKNNLSAEGSGLAFTIGGTPPSICWERDPVNMTADDALAEEAKSSKTGPKPAARDRAAEWLQELLANGSKPVGNEKDPEHGTIRLAAKEAGVSWASVRRAQESLGIKPYFDQFAKHWRWNLPEEVAQDPTRFEQPEQPEQ